MTIRTDKGGHYRYYKARQRVAVCEGMTVAMDRLNDLIANHLAERLLDPNRLEVVFSEVLRRREQIAELNRRAAETKLRLKRLYDAIESGVADLDDPALRNRIDGLKATHDRARVKVNREEVRIMGSKSNLLRVLAPNGIAAAAATAEYSPLFRSGGAGVRLTLLIYINNLSNFAFSS